jgi:hypothetical protein
VLDGWVWEESTCLGLAGGVVSRIIGSIVFCEHSFNSPKFFVHGPAETIYRNNVNNVNLGF